MSNTTIAVDDALYAYILDVSLREPELLRRLREETAALPEKHLQISPDQGQFLALLIRLMDAHRVIEVGTFTGYSALIMALALPEDGRIVTCDVNAQWTAVALRYWAEARVAERIDLRLAPALQTLDGLIASGESGRHDLVFIDADKQTYESYYERALTLLRPGGLIVVDNVLWSGSVIDPARTSVETEAIRAFNAARRDDERVDISLVPVGDGLTLARKRP